MATLQSILLTSPKRAAVVSDCAHLVDQEVSSKGGLSGLAIKGAYMAVKAIKPGIIPAAVERLMDEFVTQMEPFYQSFLQSGGKDISQFLQDHSQQVALSLLQVTDKRVAQDERDLIKKAYGKLRPTAIKNIELAIPGMARMLAKHLPALP